MRMGSMDVAESHVISGLVHKRAELAGQIDNHRQEMTRLLEVVDQLDATIRLFDPAYPIGRIRAKRYRPRQHFSHPGECQRLVLEIFRDADSPLSTRRIAEFLLQRKGLAATSTLIERMQKNALAVIRRLETKGIVQEVGTAGTGKTWTRR